MEVVYFHFQSSVNSREQIGLVLAGFVQLCDYIGVLSATKLDQAMVFGSLGVFKCLFIYDNLHLLHCCFQFGGC